MGPPLLQIRRADTNKRLTTVHYSNGDAVEYLNQWLRDNCKCPECYNSDTFQRILDTFAVPKDIHPLKLEDNPESLTIGWSDGHFSTFSSDWLIKHSRNFTEPPHNFTKIYPERVFWDKQTITQNFPVVEYKDVMARNCPELYNNIYKYGFTMIKNVPVSPQETEKMIDNIGNNIRYTHYGGFWDFTSDLAMKDTAYSDIEIPSHTDGTYWENTPYLQLFHLLYHDGEGGNTTLVDGFKCAQDYKKLYPEYYDYLKKVKVDCHSFGDIYLTQSKPIFIHDQDSDELVQISWNNCDRSSNFKLSNDEMEKFYDCIRAWNELIHRDENVYFTRLQPGTALIFDNWRALHARIDKTTGKRRMCGAYFDREDFYSFLILNNSKDETELFNAS